MDSKRRIRLSYVVFWVTPRTIHTQMSVLDLDEIHACDVIWQSPNATPHVIGLAMMFCGTIGMLVYIAREFISPATQQDRRLGLVRYWAVVLCLITIWASRSSPTFRCIRDAIPIPQLNALAGVLVVACLICAHVGCVHLAAGVHTTPFGATARRLIGTVVYTFLVYLCF